MKKFILILLLALAVAWTTTHETAPGRASSATLDPDALTTVQTPSSTPSQIIDYEGFTVSFNKDRHIPNWVSWTLTRDEVKGKHTRTNNFWQDKNVEGCADNADYRNTGYDRGHMAPAGDMKWSARAMNDCFSFANMCPQSPTLNSGSWNKLEEKTRQVAMSDSLVVVVCGPVPEKPVAHIGLNRVEVPKRFFKVILSPTATPPTAIGFIMPNGSVPGGIQASAVSVDEVEALTGYNFFSALPDEIEQEVESQCNFTRWSRKR